MDDHTTEAGPSGPSGPSTGASALQRLLAAAHDVPPSEVGTLVDDVCAILGAATGRLYVADYALRRLQRLGPNGMEGPPQTVAGTLAGRAFATGNVLVSEDRPTVLSVPLIDGTERIGLLELDFERWDGELPPLLEPVVAILVLVLITKGRYTDQWMRARRSTPLSAAAEVQWHLLPPLSCSTAEVGVGGILEPAYDIGGDSFDYALNGPLLEFAIVDAVGHGMSAVLLAAAAINGLRNARRAGLTPTAAYRQVDAIISTQFGRFRYVTGQTGSLDVRTGVLTWLNAGHVLPLLVRNGVFAGELACRPSMPFGLGGPVVQVATTQLQRGDRVLFYTDGMTDARAPDGARFGPDRLVDFLVRASLERIAVAETARRLSANVLDYVGAGLNDDATLLLLEYRAGPDRG